MTFDSELKELIRAHVFRNNKVKIEKEEDIYEIISARYNDNFVGYLVNRYDKIGFVEDIALSDVLVGWVFSNSTSLEIRLLSRDKQISFWNILNNMVQAVLINIATTLVKGGIKRNDKNK